MHTTVVLSEAVQTQADKHCMFFSHVDVSFSALDMCVSFRLLTELKLLLSEQGTLREGRDVLRKGEKQCSVIKG